MTFSLRITDINDIGCIFGYFPVVAYVVDYVDITVKRFLVDEA